MNANNHQPSKQEVAEWQEFETQFTNYLQRAAEKAKQDYLLLELSGKYDGGGSGPYVEIHTLNGGKEFRMELASNSQLASMFHLDEEKLRHLEALDWQVGDSETNPYRTVASFDSAAVAGAVTQVLREVCCVSDPGLLTYRSTGPAAQHAAALGLRHSDRMPVDVVDTTPPVAYSPENTEDLRAMVLAAVRTYLKEEPEVDRDGDIVISDKLGLTWVSVNEKVPMVIVFSLAASKVRSRQAAALELGLLNRDSLWVTWVLRGRNVWQRAALFGDPFVPEHLHELLRVFERVKERTVEDLSFRVEGLVEQ